MVTWYNISVEIIGHSSILIFFFCLFWYIFNLCKIFKNKKFSNLNKIYLFVSIILFTTSLVLIIFWITLVTSPTLFTTDEFISVGSITLFISFGFITFAFSFFLFLYLIIFEKYFIIYEIENNVYTFSKEIKSIKLFFSYKKIDVFKISKLSYYITIKDSKIFKIFMKLCKV